MFVTRIGFRAFALLSLISSLFCITYGQEIPHDSALPPSPTLRVTARLVYVDVTVRDSHGQFVRGLTPQDFKLLEDGKQQNFHLDVHSLDATSASHATAAKGGTAPETLKLRPMEFSNVPEAAGPSDAISIVLLDLLSTPQLDQLYARQQLLAFLKAMPRGQRVALFILTDRLHMVQSFTGSSDRLIAAAERINPKDMNLVVSQDKAMQDADWVAEFAVAVGHNLGGAFNFAPLVNKQNAEKREYITEGALRELARATEGYPGRKNLLWLAESFPIVVGSQLTQTRFMGLNTEGMRETSDMLANARIAVYPISLLGLEAGGVGAALNGMGEVCGGTPPTCGGNGYYGQTLNGQAVARHDLSETMNEIARETGGRAFYGTNDFVRALDNSLDDGSNYYALSYTPSNHNWNGHFRDVEVKLQRKGYSLSYRRGYFAFPDTKPMTDRDRAFSIAMQPATPESTMLLLKSRLLPPDPAHPGLMVESTIDSSNVAFTTTPDGHRHAKLLVTLIALNDGDVQPGKPPQVSGMLNIDLDPARYNFILQNGIAFRQQLPLKAGKYRLRLGVSDDASHRIGTLDMPVSADSSKSQP